MLTRILVYLPLLLLSSPSFAQDIYCYRYIMLNLDLPEALSEQQIDPGEELKYQNIIQMVTSKDQAKNLKVYIDRSPLLDVKASGYWKIQIFSQRDGSLNPDLLVFDSKQWVPSGDRIFLNQKIKYAKKDGRCPNLRMVATEKGFVRDYRTNLLVNIHQTEGTGNKLERIDSVNSWRNHKDGFNAIIIESDRFSNHQLDSILSVFQKSL